MKQLLRFWLPALVSMSLLTGMGGVTGTPEGSLPETAEDIRAVVVDRQGVRTELSKFSMEGKTSIEGTRGSGMLTVPFSELAAIEFEAAAGDRIPANAKLRSGESVRLGVGRHSIFYGSTGYGIFQIRARDVRQIEFAR